MNVPPDLKYTKSHEWVRVEGDVATIGVTDYAQSELGDVVYVDVSNVGKALHPGDSVASVESVKTVSDVYSPLSGEIVETNEALGSQSELINTDPYGKGWMVKVRVNDVAQVAGLLGADDYKGMIG